VKATEFNNVYSRDRSKVKPRRDSSSE